MLPWIHKINIKRTTAILVSLFVVVFLFSFLVLPVQAEEQAEDVFGIQPVEDTIALGSYDIRLIVAKIIRAVLGLLGVIAVSIIVYAGYTIMTSGGNEEKITKGKKILINAVIGLIIILMSVAIVQFVINALARATGLTGRPNIPGLEIQNFAGSGALGQTIEDHYPERNQKEVPRNTKIAITFVEVVDPSSLIENSNQTCWPAAANEIEPIKIEPDKCKKDEEGNDIEYYGDCIMDDDFSWEEDCDHLLTGSLSIYQSTSTGYNDLLQIPDIFVEAAAMAIYFEDEDIAGEYNARTFVFKPFDSKTSNLPLADVAYLGSGEVDVPYIVWVTDSIMKKTLFNEKAVSIFDGQFKPFYYWEFETGTELDFDPPYVTAVRPKEGSTVMRNNITQVYFNEAMDPTVTQGYLSPNTDTHLFFDTVVTGTWKLTNGYTVSEFLPDDPCGTNSCGDIMYCMPVPGCDEYDKTCTSTYGGLVRAGWPLNDDSFEAIPFSGVMDMAGNGLDSSEDKKPDGVVNERPIIPTADNNKCDVWNQHCYFSDQQLPDNYWWNYVMENDIDRTVPYVEKISPAVDTEGVAGDTELIMNFNKVLQITSFSVSNLLLEEHPGLETLYSENGDTMGRWLRFNLIEDEAGDKTELEIEPTHEFGPLDLDLYYFVSASSSIKSETQNCLYPGRGPWSSTKGNEVVCEYEEDENGITIKNENCVKVNMVSSTDAGCAQTVKETETLQPDIPTCLNYLRDNSPVSQFVEE